jgi:probable F420-dependent oxidoreductase
MVTRPFRFGVTSGGAADLASGTAWRSLARKVEGLGYSTLLAPDHLGMPSALAPLVVAAEATIDLRVGTLVLNTEFFNPVRLAQETATIDLLTEGRLELGLGSGWSRPEYDVLGMAYQSGATRADRLGTAIRTMKSAWSGELTISHPGVRPDRDQAKPAVPAPVQAPHPPILVGGHGDTILRMAAREADIVGITGLTWSDGRMKASGIGRATVAERAAFLREAAGDRAASIELNVLVLHTELGPSTVTDPAALSVQFGIDSDQVGDSPMLLVGSVSEVEDKLLAIRESIGISYYVLFESAAEAFAPVVARLAGN